MHMEQQNNGHIIGLETQVTSFYIDLYKCDLTQQYSATFAK